MINSSELADIKRRANMLADDESAARDIVIMTGRSDWPLGDRIKATLADVSALVEEVDALLAELAKRRDSPTLLSAVLGSLRADGFTVLDPGITIQHLGSVAAEPPTFDPDAAASDILGEDEPPGSLDTRDGFRPMTAPTVCPSCDKPLPPDGKCLSGYVDCQNGNTGPTTDKPKQKRAPEPPKLVTEWAPDGRDFEGYAKDLGCSREDVEKLVTQFKRAADYTAPDVRKSRWGGAFKDWAKAQMTNGG